MARHTFARKSDLWRLYNKIQLQQRFNSSLFSYPQWRNAVEIPFQNTLGNAKISDQNIVEFVNIENLSRAISAPFVVPKLPEDKCSNYLLPILIHSLKHGSNVKVFYGDNDNLSWFRENRFRPAWNHDYLVI